MFTELGVGENLATELQPVFVLLALVATLQGENEGKRDCAWTCVLFEAHRKVSCFPRVRLAKNRVWA